MRQSLLKIFEQEDDDNQDILTYLLRFARDEIRSWELEDADPFIKEVLTKYPRGASYVTFNFGSDTAVLNLLNIDDEDYHYINGISSSYGFEHADNYTIHSDLKAGYAQLFYYFNTENQNLLKQISSLLVPNLEFDLNDEEFVKEFYQVLNDQYTGELDEMVDIYVSEVNTNVQEKMKERINEDFEEIFDGTGFYFNGDLENIYTTVGNLVYKIRELDYEGGLKDLVQDILRDRGSNIGPYHEYSYNYEGIYDQKYFQDSINTELEKIWEDLSEDENIQEYLKIRERIKSKFPINQWIPIPKDNTAKMKIVGFEDEFIKVAITSNRGKFRTFQKKLSEENFYNLLYQLELFDLNT